MLWRPLCYLTFFIHQFLYTTSLNTYTLEPSKQTVTLGTNSCYVCTVRSKFAGLGNIWDATMCDLSLSKANKYRARDCRVASRRVPECLCTTSLSRSLDSVPPL